MSKTKPHLFLMTLIIGAFLPALSSGTEQQRVKVMNGYALAEFGKFADNWKLVTVRFRKDSGEMRFTYANDLAWKTLSENRTDYPDGAVFAKISAMTRPDPDFVSSAVPSGARRVQFMVRKEKDHASTDGWGYALFDAEGNVFPGDPVQNSNACAACHRLVPQRGQVFSQYLSLGDLLKPAPMSAANIHALKFEARAIAKLPAELRRALGKSASGVASVRVIVGDLAKNIFGGTLDEIIPSLAHEAVKSKLPAALVSQDGKLFSLVIPKAEAKKCSGDKEILMMTYRTLGLPGQPLKVHESSFCHAPST